MGEILTQLCSKLLLTVKFWQRKIYIKNYLQKLLKWIFRDWTPSSEVIDKNIVKLNRCKKWFCKISRNSCQLIKISYWSENQFWSKILSLKLISTLLLFWLQKKIWPRNLIWSNNSGGWVLREYPHPIVLISTFDFDAKAQFDSKPHFGEFYEQDFLETGEKLKKKRFKISKLKVYFKS